MSDGLFQEWPEDSSSKDNSANIQHPLQEHMTLAPDSDRVEDTDKNLQNPCT